jgi:predicted esterase
VNAVGDAPAVRHIRVERTARYLVLGEIGPKITDVWIVCHGYAQLATRFIERFRGIAAPNRLIVAPEGVSRFYSDRASGFHGPSAQVGASWMTSEDRENEIADYIRYLDAVYDELFALLPRGSVTLRVLGFSQGASTVARWIASGHAMADQVIIWAGSIPPELSREGAGKLVAGGRPLLLVAGDADQFITTKVLEGQVATLGALGVMTEIQRFSGGHDIDHESLIRITEDSAQKAG